MNYKPKPLPKEKSFKTFLDTHKKNAKIISRVFNVMTHLVFNINLSRDRQHSESLLVSMKAIQKDKPENLDCPSIDA